MPLEEESAVAQNEDEALWAYLPLAQTLNWNANLILTDKHVLYIYLDLLIVIHGDGGVDKLVRHDESIDNECTVIIPFLTYLHF